MNEDRRIPQPHPPGVPLPIFHNDRSLFHLLSPDLLLIVFRYIGMDDMKSYIRLAISGDQVLARFIYRGCAPMLWKHIDLAKFPGITDAQLASLLQRIDARAVTQSILFDKSTSSPLSGQGLEPLRDSRILERIDLRQSDSLRPGPTGLNDQLVSNILCPMIYHKLRVVKVRKQNELLNDTSPFQQYCFHWRNFFRSLSTTNAQQAIDKACSHCNSTLSPNNGPFQQNSNQYVTNQCTLCQEYTCRGWNPVSDCPPIRECKCCLEWLCDCVGASRPPCDYCGKWTCRSCDEVQMERHVLCRCGTRACSTCANVRHCSRDGDCAMCTQLHRCGTCNRTLSDYYLPACNICNRVTSCLTCDGGVRYCTCQAFVCSDCVRRCSSCGNIFCEGCRHFQLFCEHCSNTFCLDCDRVAETCTLCGDTVCNSDREECGIIYCFNHEDCGKGICRPCRMKNKEFITCCKGCGKHWCGAECHEMWQGNFFWKPGRHCQG